MHTPNIKIRILLLAVLFTAVSAGAVGAAGRGRNQGPPASLKIRTTAKVLKAGSLVSVDVELTNTSKRKLWIYRPAVLAFQVDLRGPQGKPVRFGYSEDVREKNGRRGIRLHTYAGSVWHILLVPGQALNDSLEISSYYDLRKPGKYTLRFLWKDPQTDWVVKSNTVTLTVTP